MIEHGWNRPLAAPFGRRDRLTIAARGRNAIGGLA
jgi:hypothetical protein